MDWHFCPHCETQLDAVTFICPACRWDPLAPPEEGAPNAELSLTERYRGTQYSSSVPAAPVLDLAQVSTSPLLARRAMVHEVEHPAYGRLPLIDTPLAIAGRARSGPYRFQPTLGQDNEEILGDLLGHRAELAELRAAGVIA